jgi:hypothetical protein
LNKIPVGKTIEFAYAFTFGHLGAILGLIWLPTVLSAVGGFFAETFYNQAMLAALTEGRPTAAGQAMVSLIAWGLVALVLGAIANVAVLRQALGLRKGPAFFHFALGPAEFRLFAAQLGIVAIMALFLLGYIFAVASLAATVQQGGSVAAIAGLVLAAVALAGAGFIVFAFVRLSFLLLPATLVEEKIAISRGWTLTQGNFWRIVVIGLATLGPLAVAIVIAQFFIMGPDFYAEAMKPGGLDAANQTRMTIIQARATLAHLPALMGMQLIAAPFIAGLMLAPAAYAYRALVPGPKLPD